MSVLEEPNGKPQIFSKWGHEEFLVIRGIRFFSPNQIFPILASPFLWFGRERTPGNLLAIVAVVVVAAASSSFRPSLSLVLTD